MRELTVTQIMQRAYLRHVLVPAFNVAYLAMVEPIVSVLQQFESFGLVEVARPDIERFGAESYEAVAREFGAVADRGCARLHQDHVPVLDEELHWVDWEPLIDEALALGYGSVMIDGSRLPLEANIEAVRRVVAKAHPQAAVEGELGAVLGHEPGPMPPYEELFCSSRGFTDVEEASRFVQETGLDWLSVAIGNIHGAISGATKDEEKLHARLNVEHLRRISKRVNIPLVLHGGTGIALTDLLAAVENGISKINIGTALRQAYEQSIRRGESIKQAQQAVAAVVAQHLRDYGLIGSMKILAE